METYRTRNQQLEEELREYKGYKLKYQVAQLYIEDDEAILELFETAKKADEYNSRNQLSNLARQGSLAGIMGQQGQCATGMLGGIFR